MAIHKDENDNLYDDMGGTALHMLPAGVVEITSAEADAIRQAQLPVPTIAELCEAVRCALQSAIDEKAKALGFSGGNALMLYAGFVNPYQSLAQSFAVWEASVWVEAGAYKDAVLAGTEPMLTPSEAVAMMPTYPL